ncbi:MAG: DNA repair protein RadC [Clostridia bacterium]|nr:DNA repair protein RadC [Clostridia bacterium]
MTHDGHRQRMKSRYMKEGLDSFAPHEVLELLLYYAIPRRDINELAHRLINHFGSVANVLDADVEDLKQVDGIGENAAVLLNLIPSLSRVYTSSKWDRNTSLLSTKAIGEYAVSMYVGKKNEEFGIICLDSNRRIHYSGIIIKGTVNQTEAYPRVVVSEVLKHNAVNVVLVHNHPSGSLIPSPSDREATKNIVTALEAIDVHVIDHIIVAGDRFNSMSNLDMLR